MLNASRAARRLAPAVAVIALLIPALVATGASANAPSASISFAGNATLVSDPGPVNLTLHYSCLPPDGGNILVSLGENGFSSGDFIPGATCDGRNHSISITLFGLFTPGTGAGTATIENGDATASATTTAKVAIK